MTLMRASPRADRQQNDGQVHRRPLCARHATRSLGSPTSSTRRRGRRDGQDVDDWLSAEQELVHHYQ